MNFYQRIETMMNLKNVSLLAVTCFVLFCVPAESPADVRLPRIFGDHMVLQRDLPIPVWGWADPGEKVSVKLGDDSVSTVADDAGKWMVKLPAQQSGDPVTLTAKGKNTITLTDVLLGEVWLCSGQSNMEWPVSRSNDFEQEKAAANYPKIRQIKIPKRPSGFPQDDVQAEWTLCSPDTVGGYTAAGYFFGRKLHKELDVPIGLVNSSWGGTRIEPWTPPCGFAKEPALAAIFKHVELTNPANAAYKTTLSAYLKDLEIWAAKAKTGLKEETSLTLPPAYPTAIQPLTSHASPTTLYNGMIHPLVPYAMRGAIWYQGESNHGEGMLYYDKMKALIGGWREVWKQGEFPFLYVQIAPYHYGSESPSILPVFWESTKQVAGHSQYRAGSHSRYR